MATQARSRTREQQKTKQVAETPAVGYQGQLGAGAIGEILKTHRANAAEARSAFLEAHPHYLPCSVAGCEGLVGPNYQRVTSEGMKYGFCPRRQVHTRLMPQVFRSR
jgi:hypothetical protein